MGTACILWIQYAIVKPGTDPRPEFDGKASPKRFKHVTIESLTGIGFPVKLHEIAVSD
jgi:hypothetical protein